MAMLTLMCAACSCSDATDTGIIEPRLVVEGYIDTDGYPSVFLTYTATGNDYDKSLSDKLIRWAKVSISDGDTTIILTGTPDFNIFPPYKYRTYEMTGTTGKTYSITAEYEGHRAVASSVMPAVTALDKIEFSPIEGNDSLRATFIHFTSPADVPAYYVVSTRSITDDTAFHPCMMGAFEVSAPDKAYRIQVYRAKSDVTPGDNDFIPHFRDGEQIAVKLSRVQKDVFEFWHIFDNEATFGSSQFINSVYNLPTNISGGIGIWSVQASSAMTATVR